MKVISALLISVLSSTTATGFQAPDKPSVIGDYMEARTCDVWTGPCFSNGEMNLTGDNAVLGWRVEKGNWEGEDLSNLCIAAAVQSEGTLSTEGEGSSIALVFIDQRANPKQAKALLAMAKSLSGKYLKTVKEIKKAKIKFQKKGMTSSLLVNNVISLRTIPLNEHCDTICGNESQAYPSLAKTLKVDCAKASQNSFQGKGLQARWDKKNQRSALVGRFSL